MRMNEYGLQQAEEETSFRINTKIKYHIIKINIEYQFHLPKCRNKDINDRNENKEDEEDDDENVYAVQPVDDDDQGVENENALINPGNKVEDPIWPAVIGRVVLRRFRRRRRRRRRGGRRRRRRGRRWG